MKHKFGQLLPPYTGEQPSAPPNFPPHPAPSDVVYGPQNGPAVPTTPAARPAYNAPAASANPVAAMQKDILALYSALKGNSDIVQWFSKDKEPAAGSEEFRKGPFAFMQFMLNRYVDKAGQRANQFDLTMPDAKEYAAPGKQLPRSSFLQYIDMLRIVGPHTTPKQVSTPDGKWGEYTNNALKAAWSIGYAFVSIAGKLGAKNFPLKMTDLQMFSKLIPDSDAAKTSGTAKKMSLFIEKITKSVNDFVNLMINSTHEYSSFITGDKRFNVFVGTKAGLSGPEQQKLTQMENQPVPGLTAPLAGLRYKDIATMQNFNAWLTNTKQDIGRTGVAQYIEELKRQLSLALEQTKAAAPAPTEKAPNADPGY
jgi:hypothetical protein